MAALREVKDRIASVRSTLKITSAMKLVASSKLRRAQRAIEALRPYERTLSEILAAAGSCAAPEVVPEDFAPLIPPTADAAGPSRSRDHGRPRSPEPLPASASLSPVVSDELEDKVLGPQVVIAFSSNSSMCGAFNANVIKRALEVVRNSDGVVETWAFGRKMAEALRKEGFSAARDYTSLVAHPDFDAVAAVSAELRGRYEAGEISGAVLVYNHFVSTGRQEVVVERFLPVEDSSFAGVAQDNGEERQDDNLYILEPSRSELLQALIPQVLDLKLYAALLDSAAAEHAARMIAMQTATDNAEELLGELTLEYNKGRQQKITAEILDLVGAEA